MSQDQTQDRQILQLRSRCMKMPCPDLSVKKAMYVCGLGRNNEAKLFRRILRKLLRHVQRHLLEIECERLASLRLSRSNKICSYSLRRETRREDRFRSYRADAIARECRAGPTECLGLNRSSTLRATKWRREIVQVSRATYSSRLFSRSDEGDFTGAIPSGASSLGTPPPRTTSS